MKAAKPDTTALAALLQEVLADRTDELRSCTGYHGEIPQAAAAHALASAMMSATGCEVLPLRWMPACYPWDLRTFKQLGRRQALVHAMALLLAEVERIDGGAWAMTGPRTWTPERCEVLARLWGEGLSAGAIAKRLGVTRNAVIGRKNRMGLGERAMVARPLKRPPVLKWPKPTAEDQERRRDLRDLEIMDRLARGEKARDVAPHYGVSLAYARDLWAARGAQNDVGEP